MTPEQINYSIDEISNGIYTALDAAQTLIEGLADIHRTKPVPRGYSRSEEDIQSYDKAARLLHIMKHFMFSEDGATHEIIEQLEKALDAIEL